MGVARNTEREKLIHMTATYRWTTPTQARNGSGKVYELLRKDISETEIQALFDELITIRGIHRVEITPSDNGYRSLAVRGTDRAATGAANVIMLSGLRAADRNANHDHAACIASAAKLGVPASWAHTPETYLSM